MGKSFGLEQYDFGVRIYDPQIGRWNGIDPLADKYYAISPFAYVAYNPVNAIDPDGKKILFINGFYSPVVGWAVGSSAGGEKYWGRGFAAAAQSFFNDYSEVTPNNYISGSSKIGGDMSGSDRYKAGYEYAETNLSFLLVGMKEGETFKMVTHSEGAAYGAGMARYLIDKGFNVETIAHLSPDEGDEFVTPKEPMTYYLSYRNDWVTNNYLINGTDKTGIVERSDLGFSTVHGSTKSAYVFKELSDLRTLNVQQIGTLGRYQVPVYKQFMSSTPNGTLFHNIEDNTNKIKFGHIHKTE